MRDLAFFAVLCSALSFVRSGGAEATACELRAKRTAGSDALRTSDGPGDPRRVEFTRPFEQAVAKAKREQRMIFLKPVYGLNDAGARDYRAGSW